MPFLVIYPRVKGLSQILVVEYDGRLSYFPGCVGDDGVFCTVIIRYLYLAEHAWRAVGSRPASGVGVVPSVAYQHFQCVVSLSEMAGDVVCEVHDPVAPEIVFDRYVCFWQPRSFAVVREVRDENLVADLFSVDIEFKISETGDEGSS